MKYELITCPFCGEKHGHITYEEARIYKMECSGCDNTILHRDHSWDAAVRFFKQLLIVEECGGQNER